jgi:hypothetical protein
MSPDRRDHRKVDVHGRTWEQRRETEAPDAEGRETEDPAEKVASGVKERRQAEAHREAQEHPKAVEGREAIGPLEAECPNSPKKGLTA